MTEKVLCLNKFECIIHLCFDYAVLMCVAVVVCDMYIGVLCAVVCSVVCGCVVCVCCVQLHVEVTVARAAGIDFYNKKVQLCF